MHLTTLPLESPAIQAAIQSGLGVYLSAPGTSQDGIRLQAATTAAGGLWLKTADGCWLVGLPAGWNVITYNTHHAVA